MHKWWLGGWLAGWPAGPWRQCSRQAAKLHLQPTSVLSSPPFAMLADTAPAAAINICPLPAPHSPARQPCHTHIPVLIRTLLFDWFASIDSWGPFFWEVKQRGTAEQWRGGCIT
jgi:hypothetical protein